MTRRLPSFTQTELSRAVKAVQAGGVAVARIEIEPTGKIIIVSGAGIADSTERTPLEEWRAKYGSR
jgi:hypothetical protein